MAMYAHLRRIGVFAVVLLSLGGAAQAQAPFPLTLSPKTVEATSTFTLTVTSTGGIDLSGVKREKISLIDLTLGEGVFIPADIFATKVVATARKLTVTVATPPTNFGGLGARQLHIFFGDVRVSLNFTLVAPFVCPASCTAPRMCIDKKCQLPPTLPTKCVPRCKAPLICNEETKSCEKKQ